METLDLVGCSPTKEPPAHVGKDEMMTLRPFETTLNAIRAHFPCKDGWEKLLLHLGKTKADDEPVDILTVLDSNGIDEALWCLRACNGIDKDARLFAVWCARQVQPLRTDPRSIAALDVAERYANSDATDVELDEAWFAACGAQWDASWDTSWPTTRAAAWCAAKPAAWAAAKAAAWCVGRGVARDTQASHLREVIAQAREILP